MLPSMKYSCHFTSPGTKKRSVAPSYNCRAIWGVRTGSPSIRTDRSESSTIRNILYTAKSPRFSTSPPISILRTLPSLKCRETWISRGYWARDPCCLPLICSSPVKYMTENVMKDYCVVPGQKT
uniref:Uncharacterized protein n=1 Tax=Cacopsylla melanoneura TaxID=428564 RepID=A0A8D8R7W5_9HEMI